jgi:fatty-acyl-CoA synthase
VTVTVISVVPPSTAIGAPPAGEVEAALADCASVVEAVVVGVPDARWGEVGCAFVVRRAGAAPDADALLRDVRARLAAYKVPVRIVELPELPKLAGSGKVDRPTLRGWAAEMRFEAVQ